MARTNTTEGQALWQLGGAEEDSRFHDSDRHLCLAYNEEEQLSSIGDIAAGKADVQTLEPHITPSIVKYQFAMAPYRQYRHQEPSPLKQ